MTKDRHYFNKILVIVKGAFNAILCLLVKDTNIMIGYLSDYNWKIAMEIEKGQIYEYSCYGVIRISNIR